DVAGAAGNQYCHDINPFLGVDPDDSVYSINFFSLCVNLGSGFVYLLPTSSVYVIFQRMSTDMHDLSM
ncbi:MAG: hypothetical protein IKM31_00385, partial [Oscillospiraceae bacterium]|nr:hypothetical protein [Oscillospiraceae bacterium]